MNQEEVLLELLAKKIYVKMEEEESNQGQMALVCL